MTNQYAYTLPAEWRKTNLEGGSGRPPLAVLVAADPGQPGKSLFLPATPQIARDQSGFAIFSMVAVVSQVPAAGEPSLWPYVEHGLLTMRAALSDGPAYAEAAGRAGLQAAYVNECIFCLGRKDAPPLVSASTQGANPSAALSSVLSAEDTRQVLLAINGVACELWLECDATVIFRGSSQELRLSTNAAALYDTLSLWASVTGVITLAQMRAALPSLMQHGPLQIFQAGQPLDANGPLSPEVFQLFVRAVQSIARRLPVTLGPLDPQNSYELRVRPSAALELNFTSTSTEPVKSRVHLCARLDEILPPALGAATGDASLDRYVQFKTAAAQGPITDLPSRSTQPREAPGMRGGPPVAPALRMRNGYAESVALSVVADRNNPPDARALVASDAVRPLAFNKFVANDLVALNPFGVTPAPPSLPRIDDPSAGVWRDRWNASLFWYVPDLELVKPAPDDAASPFLFEFSTNGVTAGNPPRPGLNATVRFTLRQIVPAAAQSMRQKPNVTVQSVPTDNLTVSVELPFRDQFGVTRTQLLPAKIQRDGGDITAVVELVDDWVRLCYGALAYNGFQSQPPRAVYAFSYQAYFPIADTPPVIVGGKRARLTVALTADQVPKVIEEPVLNVAQNQILLPGATIQLQKEAALDPVPIFVPPPAQTRAMAAVASRAPSALMLTTRTAASAALSSSPSAEPFGSGPTLLQLAPHTVTLPAFRPSLKYSSEFVGLVQTEYYIQSVVENHSLDLSLPCATFGNFYVQTVGGLRTIIGCQDALRLGDIQYKQFEEIVELAAPEFRVYRSLQQPGRFLVLPAAYHITRYAATEPAERAYRPVALVYGVLDPDPAKSRYVFLATLQPAILYYMRRNLTDRLAAYTPAGHEPQLVFPTDPLVQASTTYNWGAIAGLDTPVTNQMWDGFQVTLSTSISNALLIKTAIDSAGAIGSVVFRLPDGTSLSSQLVLDTAVTGPWDQGPISVVLGSGTATLTNRIETPVNVVELLTRQGSGAVTHLAVNATLAPGATQQVTLTAPASEAYAAAVPASGHVLFSELDIFVEDITTHVVFINLINYANHGLAAINGQMRMQGTTHTYAIAVGEGQTAAVDMTLPLSTYLEIHTVEFQITKTLTTGTTAATPWITWDMAAKGNVVSFTWDMIQ